MKLLDKCTFPLTASKCVDLIITEKCVFQVNPTSGLTLVEIYPGVSIDEIHNATACDFQVNIIQVLFVLIKFILKLFMIF